MSSMIVIDVILKALNMGSCLTRLCPCLVGLLSCLNVYSFIPGFPSDKGTGQASKYAKIHIMMQVHLLT